MAYMSQEKKKALWPKVKHILDKYGLKGSLGVHHHSTLVLNIKSGKLDFVANYNAKGETNRWKNEYWQPAKDYVGVNSYHISDAFDGDALTCLEGLKAAMMDGNHDRSDIMTDYFDVGWYIDINVGRWDKPYEVTK